MKPQRYVLRIRNNLSQYTKGLLPLVWGLFAFLALGLTSCSDDLTDVQATMAKYEPALESGKDVELIYTEDGQKRVKLSAPQLVHHKLKDPYYEFPKGALRTILFRWWRGNKHIKG